MSKVWQNIHNEMLKILDIETLDLCQSDNVTIFLILEENTYSFVYMIESNDFYVFWFLRMNATAQNATLADFAVAYLLKHLE